MKKTCLLLLTLQFAAFASAQVPQALNYQAIARNSTGQIIPSQNIGVRFSITDATGNTVFYQETYSTVTNAFGLFTLAIGKGTAVSGSVPAIDWSTGGDKYLKVEIAPQSGTNYTMQGVTQLLSVPYSLYAEKTKLISGNAITITNGNTINANYQAGNAITITGNTIAANYQAGAGINITGNTISATAGNSWLLNGNSGITASNFLGTITNENLRFRTFNQERMIIDVNGNVGIRTSAPNYLLSIQDEVHSSGSIDRRMLISLNNTSTDVDALAGIRFEANGGAPAPTNFGILAIASPAYNVVPSNTNSVILQSYTRDGLNLISSPYNVYDAAYGKIKFFTGTSSIGTLNIERMRIDSTGFVGINTQTPSAILHTNGTLRFEDINTNNTLTRMLAMDANGNVASRDASTLTSSSNDWSLTGNSGITASNFLGTITNENLKFRTFNQERMIIDVNGNVGIRTSVPSYLLSIQDEVHSSGSIDRRMLISLNNTSTDVDALAGIRFEANGGAPAPTNFGILAIASPAYNVVPSNTNSVILQSYTRDGLNLISSPYNVYDAAYGKIKFFTGTSNIGTLNIERMRIDSTGFVGINTQTPSAILHTNGTVRFQNLASGSGNILVIDNNGNVFRASQTASRTNADNKMIESLQNELNQTKKELAQIKLLISKTQKEPDVSNKQLNGKSNDIYLENVHSGVIMKSPNGHCWRMTVSDTGTPVFTAITCP